MASAKWPPATQFVIFCHCSSSLPPTHCPGDLPTAPRDTTCNAFQTKLPLMSLGFPNLCLLKGRLSVHFPHICRDRSCCAMPVPTSLHTCFLPLSHTNTPLSPGFAHFVLRLLTPLSMALGHVCTVCLSLAKECPLTRRCSLYSPEAHTWFPLIASATDFWNWTGLWGGTQQAV